MNLNLIDAREAFNLFDKLHEGKVEGKDIPNLLRSVGQNPTESDIKALIEGKEKTKFSFEEYLAIQNRPGGWKAQGTHQSVNFFFLLFFFPTLFLNDNFSNSLWMDLKSLIVMVKV